MSEQTHKPIRVHLRKKEQWSGEVTRKSDALDLEPKIFQSPSSRKIAASVRHSAEVSERRKGTVLQSAMSMINFYINRAGKNLSEKRKSVLERAKVELRRKFDKDKEDKE